MSDYDFVARSSLKLKRSNEPGLSKKSKKHKKKAKQELDERQREFVEQALDTTATTATSNTTGQKRLKTLPSGEAGDNSWMTEAQKKFLAQQEKRQLARVMEKATKSHKQRVEEFNTHLENLSEHYDIPKVSWTK